MNKEYDVVITGAGFTGLTAGLTLARAGQKVLIVEGDSLPGGLAGTFEFQNGVTIEKFYHHWFTNDKYVPELVKLLELEDQIITLPSRTGMYFNRRFWRLSTPWDLLKFTPLPFIDRLRLGLLVLKVRKVKDWRAIEHLSIREWLEPLCGPNVFRIIWEPLINAKFSDYADAVNAVWFWKKLVLRGSTRDKKGGEQLAYFKGGFGRLAQALADKICQLGGEIRYNCKAIGIQQDGEKITALVTEQGEIVGRQFLFTPALPIIADIFTGNAGEKWLTQLRRVKYLGNMCLVLQLDRSLSDTYWLNVNDPGFPFVGVIEHTNLDHSEHYKDSHIVFLSRYLPVTDSVWSYSDEQYLNFALEHLSRMFPEMKRNWIKDCRIWRAEYAQPITERDYSKYIPNQDTPFANAKISTMAQIYPEDRGTNYAIREGMDIAEKMLTILS